MPRPPRPSRRTTIRVDVSAGAGRPIGPDLFGAFFEDINYHAADGGLYAELVQNRSFAYSRDDRPDWHALTAWDLVELGGGRGSPRTDGVVPLHPANPRYAVLTVTDPGEGVGLANHGFDGIPVEAGASYRLSLYARRAEGEQAPLTVRLTGSGGTYAEAVLDGVTG